MSWKIRGWDICFLPSRLKGGQWFGLKAIPLDNQRSILSINFGPFHLERLYTE